MTTSMSPSWPEICAKFGEVEELFTITRGAKEEEHHTLLALGLRSHRTLACTLLPATVPKREFLHIENGKGLHLHPRTSESSVEKTGLSTGATKENDPEIR